MTVIETRDLSVRLGGDMVLRDVNLSIERGEIVTIVGPNGSGKSTLLRAIIGAITPVKGSIIRTPGLRIGYVPQKLHIDPTLPMTVARFMALPCRPTPSDLNAALEQAGLPDLRHQQMSELSGGQFQRVLLARALLEKPDLLILDEATQGLDQPGSAAFYKRIEEVRQTLGCSVLMVSHELNVVMSTSDRVICLNRHICCQGKPEVVVQAAEYQALFGTGTQGTLALYRHKHNHSHDAVDAPAHEHVHGANCDHDHLPTQTNQKAT